MGGICSMCKGRSQKKYLENMQQPQGNQKKGKKTHPTTSFKDINKYYVLKEVVGTGVFGVVRKGFWKRDLTAEFAVKTLKKTEINDIEILQSEVDILQAVDHPNVVKILETFEDMNFLHIVMELCKGPNLKNYMNEKQVLKEDQARCLIHQILSAVNYLHKINVVHRDIKPENIIFDKNSPDSTIKIIDFGFAVKFSNIINPELVGSPYFIAPEVIQGNNYSSKCDLWSIGVLTYYFLSGWYPFFANNEQDLFVKISEGKYSFLGWDDISEEAKDFISKLLVLVPEKRLSCEEILQHT